MIFSHLSIIKTWYIQNIITISCLLGIFSYSHYFSIFPYSHSNHIFSIASPTSTWFFSSIFPQTFNFESQLQNYSCIHSSVQVFKEQRKFHFLGFHTLQLLFAEITFLSFHMNQIFSFHFFFPQAILASLKFKPFVVFFTS